MFHIRLDNTMSFGYIETILEMKLGPIFNQTDEVELEEGIVCVVKIDEGD